jgi:hypothetical protein
VQIVGGHVGDAGRSARPRGVSRAS